VDRIRTILSFGGRIASARHYAAYDVAEVLRYEIKAWSDSVAKSADLGNPELSAEAKDTINATVARILTEGEAASSPEDQAEAFQWYLKAFEMKSPSAASALALIYIGGHLGQPKSATPASFRPPVGQLEAPCLPEGYRHCGRSCRSSVSCRTNPIIRDKALSAT